MSKKRIGPAQTAEMQRALLSRLTSLVVFLSESELTFDEMLAAFQQHRVPHPAAFASMLASASSAAAYYSASLEQGEKP